MKKRTAIILGGSPYNFLHSLDSQIKNLIDPNEADVFIVLTRGMKRRKTPASEIPVAEQNERWNEKNATTVVDRTPLSDEEIQNIKDTLGDRIKGFLVFEDTPDYYAEVLESRQRMFEIANNYIGECVQRGIAAPFRGLPISNSDNGVIRCIVDQYHHVKKAYELMEKYERENGFEYEYVMRARIDFIVPFEFNLRHYYLQDDQPYLYVCGNTGENEPNGRVWCDEFAFFCRRVTAAKLFPNLHKMGVMTDRKYNTTESGNDMIFDPEIQFAILLNETKLYPLARQVKIYRTAQYTNDGDWDYFNYKFRREFDLSHEFQLACKNQTDINEHLPTLEKYANMCTHITELGTRFGNSTITFLHSAKNNGSRFVAYDPQTNEKIDYIKLLAKENNVDFEMNICMPFNDEHTESIIEETELLFIDTNHNYESIKEDVELHSPRTKRFMIMHDSVSFWERGQGYDNGGGGMKLFLEPFIENNKEWN